MKRKPLVLLLLLALIAAGVVVFRPKPAPPPVRLHPTLRQVAQAETAVAGLGRAAAGPGRKPRALRLSENDLNVYLAGSRSARTLLASRGIEAVQIVLREPANVVVHATVRVRSQSQNIQIAGSLAPDPKTGLRFTASQAQVGSLPLPAAAITAEAQALAAHFSRRLPIKVQSVSVQKTDLVLVGLPVTVRSPQTASPQSKSPGRH